MQSLGFDVSAITQAWWDSSHDWNIVKDYILLIKTDEEGTVMELTSL